MASTTFVDGQSIIYASWLNDVNAAVYNGTFPNGDISVTNLNVTGSVTGAGFTSIVNSNLLAPGPIGSTTANSGAFTSLTASSFTSSGNISALGRVIAVSPNSGTSGGVAIKQNPGGGNAILQFLNSSGSSQWAYLTAGPGLTLDLEASGGVTVNSSQVMTLSNFGYANGTTGYQKMPGGMIIQYGQYDSTISDTSPVTITLPIPFPTTFVSVTSNLTFNTPIGGSSAQATYNYKTSNSTFNVFVGDTGSAGNVGFTWMAIGY